MVCPLPAGSAQQFRQSSLLISLSHVDVSLWFLIRKTKIWTYKSVDFWFTNYNLDFGFELFRSKITRKRIFRGQYFQRFFGNSTNIWTIKAFFLFFQNVSETSFIFYVSRFSWILCQMKWNFIFFFRIISNPYILA